MRIKAKCMCAFRLSIQKHVRGKPGVQQILHLRPVHMLVQTVSVTNTTGATVTYEGSSCICIGIQNKGLATVAATEDGQPDVKVEIISMTIE